MEAFPVAPAVRRVQFGSSTIGVDVLRWQLWASYKLQKASGIKTPDCPYTLKKHLDIPD
ncbi:hypothetical protein LC613_36640 [Nostoc sphaeroides CHAB 2801]|uniref:hypothetical protein n=1 Tax=Nostoc sphaeroides TaxID=446679 RepID=UPI001E65C2A3|nr:hypothetical protein [Nostoc sphaeroides]MCC5633054.1 hypothetical protein [Nostoc sphaeroides CHAB 2801]